MLNILYIDDDRDAGYLAKVFLKKSNYFVFCCENPRDARSILQQEKIDLIISDIGLPGESGIDFYAWLQTQEQLCRIPFIFTSAHAMGFNKLLVEHKDLFIAKPIYFPELIQKIESLLSPKNSDNR